jgi:Domain of unknown function (DUF1707)
MAGPADEIAAGMAGRGRLRASHADREQVIEVLKAAFVQGLLARDEFEARMGEALASRTYAELAAVTIRRLQMSCQSRVRGRAAQIMSRSDRWPTPGTRTYGASQTSADWLGSDSGWLARSGGLLKGRQRPEPALRRRQAEVGVW